MLRRRLRIKEERGHWCSDQLEPVSGPVISLLGSFINLTKFQHLKSRFIHQRQENDNSSLQLVQLIIYGRQELTLAGVFLT